MTDYDKDQFHTARYGESNPSEIESSIWNYLKNACRTGTTGPIGTSGTQIPKGKRTKYKELRNILGKTKPDVVVPEAGEAPEPGGRAQELRNDAPGTAAQHALAAFVVV